MEKWKKNLYVVFFAEMIAITGMAFVVPFLPFYVKELGITDVNLVAQWSGWLMGAPALVMVIISPFWGFLADRVGRKPMVERALFGSSIVIFLMAWAGNIYQLLFLRLLQGLLTGTIAACTALISTSSPSKKMGFSLGLLQTGVFLGIFLGPLLGGISADIFGFRNSFRITSALLFISGWLIFFLVEEKFTPSNTKKNTVPFKKMTALILNHKQLLVMFIILFIVQFSVKSISPILALFVETIVSDLKNVSTLTGLMFALTGLMAAFSAINIGKLIEKKPNTSLLIASLIGSGFFFLTQGFVTNIIQLALLRLCLGLFYGAIIPIANTIISLSTPSQHRGKVFGVSNSITFLGNIFGPITGGFLMVTFNISVVFVFAGSILLLSGLVLPTILKKVENSRLEQGKYKNITTKETSSMDSH